MAIAEPRDWASFVPGQKHQQRAEIARMFPTQARERRRRIYNSIRSMRGVTGEKTLPQTKARVRLAFCPHLFE